MGRYSYRMVISFLINRLSLSMLLGMLRLSLFFTLFLSPLGAAEVHQFAPHKEATIIDQRDVHLNGCGPVSLLNAYRHSGDNWRQTESLIPGDDEGKFLYLTKKFGRQYSPHYYMRQRWDAKKGMHSLDLRDMANSFHKHAKQPTLSLVSYHLKAGETHQQLLVRVHASLKQSLDNGFAPILSVKRFYKKPLRTGFIWSSSSGHYVVVYRLPKEYDPSSTELTIQYIDPWRGRILSGVFTIPQQTYYANDITRRPPRLHKSPALLAKFPFSTIGTSQLMGNEPTALILNNAIGLFDKSTNSSKAP